MSTLAEKRNKILNFVGPIAATCTPYNENGDINPSMVDNYSQHLLKIGVNGVYVHGSTGEGLSLTNDERISLTHKWMKDLNKFDNFLTIFNVSSTSIVDSIAHAKVCEQLKVDAIAVLPPIYYRPNNVIDLVKYLKLISQAAPNTPLVYYHIPSFTHVSVNLNEFIELALKEIPSFTAMKYTSEDIISVQRVQYEFSGRFKVFMGFEETLLSGLACNINASVGSFFNLECCTKAYLLMGEAFAQNKISAAKQQQKIIADKVKELSCDGKVYINVRKAMKEETCGKVDVGNPRPPIYM